MAQWIVVFGRAKMKVIETPPGKFTDAAFHVWETELGEKMASHVTSFRDKTIKGLFKKD